jgi:Skp family chaperone for outer membrane proteins
MLKKIIIIIFLLISYSNVSKANQTIYVIDFEFLVNNSNYSKKVFYELDQYIEKKKSILNEDAKLLKESDNNLSLKKNVISKKEFENEASELSKKIKDFNQKKEKISLEINSLKQEKIADIIKKINPVIKKFSDDNDVDIIFDLKSVIISKNKFDITNEMLEKINTELK